MRYCFKRDDDGHNYLIPVSMRKSFENLLAAAIADDCYADFNDVFMQFSIDAMTNWTFENPKEDA